MLRLTLFIFLMIIPSYLYSKPSTNLLGIGQGISSPSVTSTIILSSGYTGENPVGVAYQKTARFSAEYDKGENQDGSENKGYGGELGGGNGKYGIALGYYTKDCDNCDGDISAALGGLFSGIGAGIAFRERLATFGLIINPTGKHRLGLIAERHTETSDDNDITDIGVGYSFIISDMTFTVDASKRQHEDHIDTDEVILVTPGVSIRFRMIALSISNHSYFNDESLAEEDKIETNLWWGVGLGSGQKYHLAIYGDYVNELAAVGSLFF